MNLYFGDLFAKPGEKERDVERAIFFFQFGSNVTFDVKPESVMDHVRKSKVKVYPAMNEEMFPVLAENIRKIGKGHGAKKFTDAEYNTTVRAWNEDVYLLKEQIAAVCYDGDHPRYINAIRPYGQMMPKEKFDYYMDGYTRTMQQILGSLELTENEYSPLNNHIFPYRQCFLLERIREVTVNPNQTMVLRADGSVFTIYHFCTGYRSYNADDEKMNLGGFRYSQYFLHSMVDFKDEAVLFPEIRDLEFTEQVSRMTITGSKQRTENETGGGVTE